MLKNLYMLLNEKIFEYPNESVIYIANRFFGKLGESKKVYLMAFWHAVLWFVNGNYGVKRKGRK